MKLYYADAPNPRAVRMFLVEKGISDVEIVPVDLRGGENRTQEHYARNPSGQLPVLEIADAAYISEVTAICEYLEERYPEPALIGDTAAQRAETRMWIRKLDFALHEPLSNSFRSGVGRTFFEKRMPVYPDATDAFRQMVQTGYGFLEERLSDNDFIVGDRFSLADILSYSLISFFSSLDGAVDKKYSNVIRWLDRISSRPSTER